METVLNSVMSFIQNQRSLLNASTFLPHTQSTTQTPDQQAKTRQQELKTASVIHTHIYPRFSRRIDAVSPLNSSPIPTPIPPPTPFLEPHTRTIKVHVNQEVAEYRITTTPLKYSHKITLVSPFTDAFLHYTHTATLFTLKTMIKRQRIDLECLRSFLPQLVSQNKDGYDFNNLFANFPLLVAKLVDLCIAFPRRYLCNFTVHSAELAVLSFTEIVLSYRSNLLLEFDMRPSDWDVLVEDLTRDLDMLQVSFCLPLRRKKQVSNQSLLELLESLPETSPNF